MTNENKSDPYYAKVVRVSQLYYKVLLMDDDRSSILSSPIERNTYYVFSRVWAYNKAKRVVKRSNRKYRLKTKYRDETIIVDSSGEIKSTRRKR